MLLLKQQDPITKLGYLLDQMVRVGFGSYENYHKRQIDYDEKRKQQIINTLGCEFIEIKEWEL
jgi:hypothetical protein